MNKIQKGLLWGTIAGTIDVLPMIYQKLPWDANISAFTFWVIAGFIIATSTLKFPNVLKGTFLALVLIIPVAVLVAWKSTIHLLPISIMTVLLGSALGHFID